MKQIKVGVVGCGYWGPNLARNVQASRSCELAAIGDPSPARLAQARLQHRGIRLTDRWSDVVADRSIDAVAIATPVDSHFELAWAALAAECVVPAGTWARARISPAEISAVNASLVFAGLE